MTKTNFNSPRAFSLIELSIVILIIGILIAGVTQGSRLVTQMRLATARNLTQGSPIASTRDLAIWLESTSIASLDDSATEDNAPIQNWYDINPQAITKYNALQTTGTKQPTYSTGAINGLPAVKFDGINDDMSLGSLSAGSNISLFFVIKPTTSHVEGLFDSAPGQPYVFRNHCDSGCPTDGQFSWWNSAFAGTAPAVNLGLSAANPTIVYVQTTFNAGASTPKNITYYRNGTFVSSANDTDTSGIAWASPRIGSINTNYILYNGIIGEIVIFSRTLKAEERNSVTSYLGKKWGIKTP